MRPHNLRIDLSPESLQPIDFHATQLTDITMPHRVAYGGKLPLSRSQTDPIKRLAFVDAEVIPSDDAFPRHQSQHRCSTDSSDGEQSVRSRSPMSGPNYTHAIDKPTSTYAASLARRSRANTTDSTPAHSPTRSSRPRCPNCGAHKQSILPPATSTPADRACSPPRSKHFLNIQGSLSTALCDACTTSEHARLVSSDAAYQLASLRALMGLTTDGDDEMRQSRRRRRRGSSGHSAGDT